MKLSSLNVRDMQRNWNGMAKSDPYWAVLTDDAKRGGKWSVEEFFSTGRTEIQALLDYAAGLKVDINHGLALDFGCGVGRLTQALADHFAKAIGVDISEGMVEQARSLNKKGERCEFRVNAASDLSQFDSGVFDFVYSSITLQHIDPIYSRTYLAEFIRILKPGGVLIFQLPSHRSSEQPADRKPSSHGSVLSRLYWGFVEILHTLRLRKNYRELIRKEEPIIPMHGIVRSDVESLINSAGADIVEVKPDSSAGPQWISFRYCVIKR